MSVRRVRLSGLRGVAAKAVLGVAVAVCGLILALASNPATGESRWPWGLDLVRRHPWPSVGVCAVAGIIVLPLLSRLVERHAGAAAAISSAPAPALPDWVVARPQVRAVAAAVCSRRRWRTVAITTAIHGAGGFGKTKVAEAVCADRRVQRRYGGRVHMLTIGQDTLSSSAIAERVGEATRLLTGDQSVFESPRAAGDHLAKLLAGAPPTLLVLDDVWHAEQVAPFLRAAAGLTLLVTTRRPAVLPRRAKLVEVDEMRAAEARAVLTHNLNTLTPDQVDALADACGNWPLLLRLANRTVVALASTGLAEAEAAAQVAARLRAQGPAALDGVGGLDPADPDRREHAVCSSLELAFELLPPGGRARFVELGVFAEDEEVPVDLVLRYWGATAGLAQTEARLLCRALADLSLVGLRSSRGGALRLHDVYRDLLRAELADRLPGLNARLIQAAAQGVSDAAPFPGSGHTGPAWWTCADGYLPDHLVEHLIAAGQADQAAALCADLRWIRVRLRDRGPNAPLRDLACVGTAQAQGRSRDLSEIFHLLRPTETDRSLAAILASRLADLPAWREQAAALTDDPGLRPLLVNGWSQTDLPHPAMLRMFPSAASAVKAVAFSHDGASVAYATQEGTEIADLADATVRDLFTTPRALSLLFSPDGLRLAVTSDEGPLFVDLAAGRVRRLRRTAWFWWWARPRVFAPDGSWLDRRPFAWYLREPFGGGVQARFKPRRRLPREPRYYPVRAPDGSWLAAISDYQLAEAWIWDLATGEPLNRLDGHRGKVTALALSADGATLASAGEDATVRLWDTATWTQRAVLTGHDGPVTELVYGPDGSWVASGGADSVIRVWGPGERPVQLAAYSGHIGAVTALAAAVDGTRIASGGADGTVRIWQTPRAAVPASRPVTRANASYPIPSYSDKSLKRRLPRMYTSRRLRVDGHWYPDSAKPTTPGTGNYISPTEFRGWAPHLAVSPDGSWIATGSMDHMLRVWDAHSGSISRGLAHSGFVFAVAAGPDGKYVASADLDGTILISDPVTGATLKNLGRAPRAPRSVASIALSPDGSWLAAVTWLGGLHIWEAEADEWRHHALPAGREEDPVRAVAISRDGSRLIVRTKFRVIVERRPGGERAVIRSESGHGVVHPLALSPDGRLIVAGDRYGWVRAWQVGNAPSGKVQRTSLPARSRSYALAFSPDGRWLASTHTDETLRIWNVSTWQVAAEMRAAQWYGSCAWAPDGSCLYVLGPNTLYRYDWRV